MAKNVKSLIIFARDWRLWTTLIIALLHASNVGANSSVEYFRWLWVKPLFFPGRDNISNRIFKDSADILAQSVSFLLNSSFADQKLPDSWKLAKVKPVCDINQHLQPISCTHLFRVQASRRICHMKKYVAPVILESIDPNQHGGLPIRSYLIKSIRSNKIKSIRSRHSTCTWDQDGTVALYPYDKQSKTVRL